jgi:hypothetical protein
MSEPSLANCLNEILLPIWINANALISFAVCLPRCLKLIEDPKLTQLHTDKQPPNSILCFLAPIDIVDPNLPIALTDRVEASATALWTDKHSPILVKARMLKLLPNELNVKQDNVLLMFTDFA